MKPCSVPQSPDACNRHMLTLLTAVFSRPDFPQLRQNSLGEFRSLLTTVEKDFLGHGDQWINGEKPGLADVHVCLAKQQAVL